MITNTIQLPALDCSSWTLDNEVAVDGGHEDKQTEEAILVDHDIRAFKYAFVHLYQTLESVVRA